MNDIFWFENPLQLINKKYILNILPNTEMNQNEKLNSLVRLSFLVSLILLIITNNTNYFIIFFITLLATLFIWNQHKENYKEEKKPEKIYQTEFDITNSKFLEDLDEKEAAEGGEEAKEGGEKKTTKAPYVPDNTAKVEGCTMPKKNNPMLNLTPGNYYDDIFSCPLSKEFKDLQKKYLMDPIYPENNKLFHDNLYERQFYTIPHRENMINFLTRFPLRDKRKKCTNSTDSQLARFYACSF